MNFRQQCRERHLGQPEPSSPFAKYREPAYPESPTKETTMPPTAPTAARPLGSIAAPTKGPTAAQRAGVLTDAQLKEEFGKFNPPTAPTPPTKYAVHTGAPPAEKPRHTRNNEALSTAVGLPVGGWFVYEDAKKTFNCKTATAKWSKLAGFPLLLYRTAAGKVVVKRLGADGQGVILAQKGVTLVDSLKLAQSGA